MSWSIKLVTVRGIPIRVHISFLAILIWAAYLGLTGISGARGETGLLRGAVFMILFTLLLFLCVVLHELGHSLVAQLFGVKVHDITLWPVGGVARLSRMPERPYQEFLITAAGPAVNVLLAVGLGVVALVWIGPQEIASLATSARQQARLMQALNGQTLVVLLAAQNVLLVVFNLIPAFPMDGGRLLRSFLAAFISFPRATRIASYTGQVLAVGLILASFIPPGSLFLSLAGLFVFLSAWQERQQVTATETLAGLYVRDAMQPLGVRLHPLQTLGEAVALVARLPQAGFMLVDAGRLVRVVTRSELLAAVRKAGPGVALGRHFKPGFGKARPDEALSDVQERLQEWHVLAVIEDDRAVGIIDGADAARVAEARNAYPGAVPKG